MNFKDKVMMRYAKVDKQPVYTLVFCSVEELLMDMARGAKSEGIPMGDLIFTLGEHAFEAYIKERNCSADKVMPLGGVIQVRSVHHRRIVGTDWDKKIANSVSVVSTGEMPYRHFATFTPEA